MHILNVRPARGRWRARASALLVALSIGLAPASPLVAPLAAQPADTTKISKQPLFTERDAWLAGGFVLATVAMFPVDRWAARNLQDSTVQANRFFRHQATNVRLVTEATWFIGGGLYAVGKLTGNREMADLGLHGTEAVAVALGTVLIGKGILGRQRPYADIHDADSFVFLRGFGGDSDAYRSFPSGHTASAFAAASAVSAEAARFWPRGKWLVRTTMYGGATLVGLSRMFNNKHWASDVAMGAAIGTFSGLKVVHYHHSHPDNKIDEWLLGADVVPLPDGGVGLALTVPVDLPVR